MLMLITPLDVLSENMIWATFLPSGFCDTELETLHMLVLCLGKLCLMMACCLRKTLKQITKTDMKLEKKKSSRPWYCLHLVNLDFFR